MFLKTGLQRQVYATIATSMSIFISGMWLGWSSSAADKFIKRQADIQIGYDELSWVVSLMDLGNVLSPVLAGYLMDRIGRRRTIAALGPLFLVSWLLTVYVPHVWALYVARLMAGFGKGTSYTVVPVFLGEIAGVNVRGALGSVFTIQLSAGFLFEVIIGPLISYHTLNLFSTVVPVLFIVMLYCVPESPYYLLKVGRRQEAADCLRWYRCCDDAALADELQLIETTVQRDMENKGSFRELFGNPKNLKALTVVVTACTTQRAGGVSCLIAYGALLLPEPAPGMGKAEYIMVFAALIVAVNFVGMALVDRVGRKPLLVGSEAGLAVITFVFGLYYYHYSTAAGVGVATWPAYACLVAFATIYSIGIGFVPVVLLGEMFTVNVRSHCSAITSIALAFNSFVSNKTFLYVSDQYGVYTVFWAFAFVNVAGAYAAHRYAIETTGKTFLEIQDLLEESVRKDGPKQEPRNIKRPMADAI